MTTQLALPDDGSPFDRGRMPCPQGGEDRWSARWLMQAMGYNTWQKFESVIERAKVAASQMGMNASYLFAFDRQPPPQSGGRGGRPRTEYHVTRYAAYLIAANCDPRKPQVSAAQHYFLVKARIAERHPSLVASPTVGGSGYSTTHEFGNPFCLYVLELVGFGTKVGISTKPMSRLAKLRSDANRHGRTPGRVWISCPHREARANERRLIHMGGPGNLSEYLRLNYDSVLAAAQKLTYTQAPVNEPTNWPVSIFWAIGTTRKDVICVTEQAFGSCASGNGYGLVTESVPMT